MDTGSIGTGTGRCDACPEDSARRSSSTVAPFGFTQSTLATVARVAAQFKSNPETYLEQIRAAVPRFDELQEQAVAAIPFAPDRVLELGMGTGETTRHLLEAYPDAWVIGLDSSAEMVFHLRREYDDVQLARMEDPLPDGPRDLVNSVLAVNELTDDQKRMLFRRVREQAR